MDRRPAFAGAAVPRPSAAARTGRAGVLRCSAAEAAKRVLVVNTKGGGHAAIGPHLAEKLLSLGHTVAVRQVGDESRSGPFERYAALQAAFPDAFSLSFGPPDAAAIPPAAYDAIYDNNSKSPADAAAAIDAASAGAELFYVSSAGAYAYDPNVAPHLSGDAASGATIEVEDAMRGAGVCSAVFRPIYVVGPGSAKREYLDFFFDRIVRGRPVPVPGHPSNLVSLTDVRDVAAMMAGALGRKMDAAIFNAVSPRAVSVEGIARMCAAAASAAKPTLVAYDASAVAKAVDGFAVKRAFPFRPRHFFADPFLDAKSAAELDWDPAFSGSGPALDGAVAQAYAEYVSLGLNTREVDFSLDDAILAAASS
jgi:nucleoside-diphosphate-sugar epimerase